jgi:deazaflavin-dependent oxidoreductase (nitroreductase family)
LFDGRTGSYGGLQPRSGGAVGRWVTRRVIARIRRTGRMPVVRFDALVVTTIGRKTGEPRTVALAWFPWHDRSKLIVAAALGGRKNPAWYYNIAASPHRLTIEYGGTVQIVDAHQLGGREREDAWQSIIRAEPQLAAMQRKTDRPFPIIRLDPAVV